MNDLRATLLSALEAFFTNALADEKKRQATCLCPRCTARRAAEAQAKAATEPKPFTCGCPDCTARRAAMGMETPADRSALVRELKAAELALQDDTTEARLNRVRDAQSALAAFDATATVDEGRKGKARERMEAIARELAPLVEARAYTPTEEVLAQVYALEREYEDRREQAGMSRVEARRLMLDVWKEMGK